MEKVVYSKENRTESYPFIGCFSNIGGIYYELTSFCEQKKFFEPGNSSKEKKVDGEKTVNEIFKKIFPKESNVEHKKKKYILFYGKSAMENLSSFYNHLLFSITQEWIDDDEDVVIMLFLEYFNSGTAKALIQIISTIVSNFKERAKFVWLSDADDSDSFDSGKEIREIVSFEDLSPNEMFHIEEVVYYFHSKWVVYFKRRVLRLLFFIFYKKFHCFVIHDFSGPLHFYFVVFNFFHLFCVIKISFVFKKCLTKYTLI